MPSNSTTCRTRNCVTLNYQKMVDFDHNGQYNNIMNGQDQEQQQLIGYWLKSRGLTLKDLEKHKCIDDLILLLNIKQQLHNLFNQSEHAHWGALWNIVHKSKRRLRNKHLDKLYCNVEKAQNRQQTKQAKIQTMRANINSQKTSQQMI